MTIPEILKELEVYTRRFPKDALLAAVEQREAITPELLRVLEAVAQNPAEFAKKTDYMLHLFALYLLAQFRETRAYEPIIKIFSAPGEITYDLAGDTVTEGLNRILASVYDGNPGPLRALIENDKADEFVRNAAIESFLVLENVGLMPRAEVVDYFRSLFQSKLERTHSFAWDGLVCVVADFPAPELLPEVREAYKQGLVDPGVAGLKEIEADTASPPPWRTKKKHLITDAIQEMENWAAFHPEEPSFKPAPIFPSPRVLGALFPTYEPAQPFVREVKVGRNEPCPCGSGKKYKKCCGA